ncbi:hypothetical protein SAY86_023476 [Trapa natans]|uniref:Uncharacterized protein n=1 Tax=Trapa natans TaxID=22666 RepID=A0AAN7MAH2_TRANT|nr:hypothetical protein SAY86_023476 [Trapa natans]
MSAVEFKIYPGHSNTVLPASTLLPPLWRCFLGNQTFQLIGKQLSSPPASGSRYKFSDFYGLN